MAEECSTERRRPMEEECSTERRRPMEEECSTERRRPTVEECSMEPRRPTVEDNTMAFHPRRQLTITMVVTRHPHTAIREVTTTMGIRHMAGDSTMEVRQQYRRHPLYRMKQQGYMR
jgi:hypothetical protein